MTGFNSENHYYRPAVQPGAFLQEWHHHFFTGCLIADIGHIFAAVGPDADKKIWQSWSQEIQDQIKSTGAQRLIIDVTGQPWKQNDLFRDNLERTRIRIPVSSMMLTGDAAAFYHDQPDTVWFPTLLYLYHCRHRFRHQGIRRYRAGTDKTQFAMSLNNVSRWHRSALYAAVRDRACWPQINFSFIRLDNLQQHTDRFPTAWQHTVAQHQAELPLRLPGEPTFQNDLGIESEWYDQCAINIVTETDTDLVWITEKAVKPFLAQQIPVMLGAAGFSQHLQDLGFDMFADIVPWQTWDESDDPVERIELVAAWLDSVARTDWPELYRSVQDRVERNHAHVFSQALDDIITSRIRSVATA